MSMGSYYGLYFNGRTSVLSTFIINPVSVLTTNLTGDRKPGSLQSIATPSP